MANYAVDPSVLQAYLPYKTELDLWEGTCYLSLVGFMFVNTKVMGIKVPFHVNFEEVNLRFYVRYLDGGEWKRGVVFIKEIVPKPALTLVANTLYKEHYETMPMRHRWEVAGDNLAVEYHWKKHGMWHSLQILAENRLQDISNGSEAEFITEHYWGYTQINARKTSEYGVEHPRWQIYKALSHTIEADFARTYGQSFAFLNHETPKSVFLAEGSEILVREGKAIRG